MYVVVKIKWHQYILTEWTIITVDKIWLKEWEKEYKINDILLAFEEWGKTVNVWKPIIKWSEVIFDVVDPLKKMKKIRVLKFRRKNRYQRVYWFRAQKTVLKVKKITIDG